MTTKIYQPALMLPFSGARPQWNLEYDGPSWGTFYSEQDFNAVAAELDALKAELAAVTAQRDEIQARLDTELASCWQLGFLKAIERGAAVERQRDALKAELDALKQKTSSMMGVGNGAGNLFVYGDYESIKAAQTLLLQAENDRAELEAARKQEPCGYQSNFIGEDKWVSCSKERYDAVKSAPNSWRGYEVRAVYASPVPEQRR